MPKPGACTLRLILWWRSALLAGWDIRKLRPWLLGSQWLAIYGMPIIWRIALVVHWWSASPDTLEAALAALVSDPALRQELGRRGREYVEREWSYEALAPRYDALHQEVWKHNRLGRTLWAKWTD